MRHALDGNAIAADAHYGQPGAVDFTECGHCGCDFADTDDDDFDPRAVQSRTDQALCQWCADTIDAAE